MDIEAPPRQFARTQRFTFGVPKSFTPAPERDVVVFLRTRGGDDPVSCLWVLEEGVERLLADPARLGWAEDVPELERDRRQRTRERSRGIVAYSTDAGVQTVVFPLDGRLWTVPVAGGEPAEVPVEGPAVDPHLDPSGTRVAYVSAGALHVVALEDGRPELSVRPEHEDVAYGVPEHTEMSGTTGHFWAPDGRAVLALRVDTTAVTKLWIADPSRPDRAPRCIAYPVAGTTNAVPSLHVLGLDGSRVEVGWDHSSHEYLLSAAWDPHGILFSVQSRDQRSVRVLAADPATGTAELLHEATDPAWVTWIPGVPRRAAGGTLLLVAGSEDTYRLVVDGVPVTPPGLQVREVLAVVGDAVLFAASEDPTEEHVWSWDAAAGLTPLTVEPGVHRAVAAGGVRVLSSHTESGRRFTTSYPGRADLTVACHEAGPLVPPRVTWLEVGVRRLRTALLLPTWHVPGKGRLPVLMSPYGGPAGQRVTRARHWYFCEAQWFAEQGFAVVMVDGSGTPGRGMAWDREILGDSLSSVLADQVAGLHGTAEQFPELDLGRVGMRGWSFGGTLAAAAVLRRPDVFHCAVSGAAPSDVALYYTHYRERFLGTPEANPEGYARGSNVNEAAALERPLLLVHGLADDNVFVAHTLRMSAALFAAGKEHELLLLPDFTHMTTDETAAMRLLLREFAFLGKWLEPEGPSPTR